MNNIDYTKINIKRGIGNDKSVTITYNGESDIKIKNYTTDNIEINEIKALQMLDSILKYR